MQKALKSLGVVLTTAALAASSAFAAQNVANTSQKGSLLMYARIDIRNGNDTIVRMSNDNNRSANVKCYYMNEKKGRRDFAFTLTKKQPVWWSVASLEGSITPAAFPNNGNFDGDPNVGELICWAVNAQRSRQVSFNHLFGSATIYNSQLGTAFEYNSWNFIARGVPLNQPVGDAGALVLNGESGSYDACPSYLVTQISPAGAVLPNGAAGQTEVSVIGCRQDLRQDFSPTFTKLELTAWNEDEVPFTGAYECANSYHSFPLTGVDVAPEIFTARVLQSEDALVRVEGVESTQCRNSVDVGLVGVRATDISQEDRATVLGTTFNGAGTKTNGIVLWDAEDDDVPERR